MTATALESKVKVKTRQPLINITRQYRSRPSPRPRLVDSARPILAGERRRGVGNSSWLDLLPLLVAWFFHDGGGTVGRSPTYRTGRRTGEGREGHLSNWLGVGVSSPTYLFKGGREGTDGKGWVIHLSSWGRGGSGGSWFKMDLISV